LRKKHPNADKLSVCRVDAGTGEILNIVCGAPNVDAGQTVCVALVGAIVPNGEFEIKKAKIRGEASEGMICSARERIGGYDHTGIMV
jgi:phenylalanyl-tRNA synthetase beta chain